MENSMTTQFAITLGARARALVAALVLGTAVLSLVPGQTAYAADTSIAVSAKPKPKSPTVNYCYVQLADGSFVLYEPGELILHPGLGNLKCGKDGKWYQVRTGAAIDSDTLNGGVYAP
jgi:hypothetical protein